LLACTDLQLLVPEEDSVFDTLDLLAKASVNNLIKANANCVKK
jgi:aspartate/glutamate racemase